MRGRIFFLTAAAALAAACLAAAGPPAGGRAPADDGHDFVFFGETRPVLVRLHVRIDNRPLARTYDDFLDHLFKVLDTNKDGVLSQAELERLPPPQVLFSPGGFLFRPARPPAVRGRPGVNAMEPRTRAELAHYLRANGVLPFQVTYSGAAARNVDRPNVVFVSGLGNPPPAAEDVNEALFKLLDTDRDGKLSRAELAAAPDVLARLDMDDDDMITREELLPNSGGGDGLAVRLVPAVPGRRMPAPANTGPFLAVGAGTASDQLAQELLTRYGKEKERTQSVTRTELGLDRETFNALDGDGNGVLDRDELARFADRPADLEAVIRFGQRRPDEAPVEVVRSDGRPGALAANARLGPDGGLTLDLGNTRLELRLGNQVAASNAAGIRQQYVAQFKQADRDNNGYLDESEAQSSPFFRTTFKLMDRDGDGKLFENEMLAYVDEMIGLQVKAQAAVASLNAADVGSGIFDLFDTNHDGRLSVRELRQAVKLVDQLDKDGDGAVSRREIPKSYQLTVQRGPAAGNAAVSRRVVLAADGRVVRGGPTAAPSAAGPLWFRKMDRNHDGDVSRREFLGSDEEFRRIDTDGDGLISAEEAERYDAQMRKGKGP